MDEITLEDKAYVSSKRAAQITGYAKDYVGQLCREGRVEARLVGRNWYVLESSIRAHRFGAPAPVAGSGRGAVVESSNATDYSATWQAPSYTAEAPTTLPTLVPAPAGNFLDTASDAIIAPVTAAPDAGIPAHSADSADISVDTALNSSVVKEMQSAWHDWFSRTNELAVSEETLLENPSDYDQVFETNAYEGIEGAQKAHEADESEDHSDTESVPVHLTRTLTEPSEAIPEASSALRSSISNFYDDDEDSFDKVTTPITLEKVNEVIEDEYEEKIPLKRSYTSTQSTQSIQREKVSATVPVRSAMSPKRAVSSYAGVKDVPTSAEATGRIIRERKVVAKGKPSLALQALLLSIAGLAVVVALIGTGKLDSLFNREHINYAPINYLVGQSSVGKAN
jgi:hypothetical protein